MFKLDNNLLDELGLSALPPQEKNKMLGHIYQTLEMRVGMKLAENMSNEQLDEFERFVNGDIQYCHDFLSSVDENWQQSERFTKQIANAKTSAEKQGVQLNENAVISEFAALTWLETNFPDYKKVVAAQLEALKTEIKQNAEAILAASKEA